MNRRTSTQTYYDILNNGYLSAKRWQVYDIFYQHGDLTGAQVSKLYRLSFPSSKTSETIRNRITELVRMGVVEEIGTTTCEDSGREVILFGINDKLPRKLEIPKTMHQKKMDILDSIKGFATKHQIKKLHPEMRDDLLVIHEMVSQLTKRRK